MLQLQHSTKQEWHCGLQCMPSIQTAIRFFFLISYCSRVVYSDAPFPFIEDARQSLLRSDYDYIIVGGGAAGCSLAATLSLNFTVLVLERGGVPFGNPNIERAENFGPNLADINDTAPAQEFISEDGVGNRRARVLGGGTCLNAGFYSRASSDYVNRSGWDVPLVEDSYRWVEQQLVFIPDLGEWQSAFRDGLLEAGVLPDRGVTLEHLIGTKTGASIFDGEGRRHTAAELLGSANSSNIAVLVHATVQRILFRSSCDAGDSGCRPRAYGVLFSDTDGTDHLALLNPGNQSEVILCAGALGSPQLLLLSGVGPAENLSPLGIPLVLDVEGVGKGMADNPTNLVFVPSPRPIESSSIKVVGITDFGSFIEAGSMGSLDEFMSTQAQKFSALVDPRPSKRSTVQIGARIRAEADTPIPSLAQSTFSQIGIVLEKVVGPLSSGELLLRTTNISDNPSVRFNYFTQPQDLESCIQGMRVIERVINSAAMVNFTFRMNATQISQNLTNAVLLVGNALPNTLDTDALARFCRRTVMTLWHYHGGCQVGRVVDSDYRVRGVGALRVVDGSTFEFTPGTNPQATVMMLGRYMGMQILRERLH
ncbi:hypothetical protein O6H91_14G012800 [Diphasiastrum complanatum]|uniref:Uncharacterized protein n=1 Tax=Diphasiastrum complanatum TaxID=34168 RepID=A0ACC2BLQ3_DIPCM|nr:hypothetical protein O6H91_14G012800 [Diphasiastrum complanatum]